MSVLTLDSSDDDEFNTGNSMNNSLHIDVDDEDNSKSDHQRKLGIAVITKMSWAYARKSSYGNGDDTISLDTVDLTRR